MNRITRLAPLLFVFLTLFSIQKSFAQGEANIWYFGNKAGLDFNSGSPAALTNGDMNTSEGCSSISDASGNLLLYTSGTAVWDRMHNAMPNGSGLNGHSSSTQSALIVSHPGTPDLYYIFNPGTNDLAVKNFSYSIVDMTLNGGLGDVVPGSKNILPSPGIQFSEKLTATLHDNGTDIWVIVHRYNSNAFHAYLLTASGLDNTPVVSNTGSSYSSLFLSAGQLKASLDGSRLVAGFGGSVSSFELFDFDNNTGIVSNPKNISGVGHGTYGIEFSPDATKVYASAIYNFEVSRFDISSGVPATIQASQVTVTSSANPADVGGALQLAPNGEIYYARNNVSVLGSVRFPNSSDTPVLLGSTALAGRDSRYGLPTFFQGYLLPKIDVQGLGESISRGDDTPSLTDGTDFGNYNTCSPLAITRTYTILNNGNTTLNLTGTPLVSVGFDPAFSVSAQPAASSIPPGGSLDFEVSYSPISNGTHTATVSIQNDAMSLYTFDIQGGLAQTLNTWVSVGSPAFSAGATQYTDMAFHPVTQEPYVVYRDDANSGATSVMRFDGTNWVNVGVPGFSDADTYDHKITFDPVTNEPYVCFVEGFPAFSANVMRFNGGAWVNVGAPDFSAADAFFTNLYFHPVSNEPYLAYMDGSIGYGARLQRFDGFSWVDVTAPGFTPAGLFALDFNLDDSGTPFIAYKDPTAGDAATVIFFDGTTWQTLGTPGFSAGVIDDTFIDLSFHPATGEVYIAYKEDALSGKISVMRFDGGSWVNVGPTGFSAGINPQYLDLEFAPFTHEPYIAFGLSTTSFVMSFDGTAWNIVGSAPPSGAAIFTSLDFHPGTGEAHIAFGDALNSNAATTMRFVTNLAGIELHGNSLEITNGDITPDAADFTDFGSTTTCTAVSKTFEIYNTGVSELSLIGAPLVSISGSAAFTVTAQPSANTLSPCDAPLTFTIEYAPSSAGTDDAVITVLSNDTDDGTFTFEISGAATDCVSPPPTGGGTTAGEIHVPPCIYAVGQSSESIRVWWCDASENETAYEVWRKSEFDTDFYRIATVPGADTEIIKFIDDLNLKPDTEYTYWVVTVHHNQKSHPSDLAKDYTFPLTPEVSVSREACINGSAELLAEGSHRSGKFRWYENETGGEFLSEEALFETESLTSEKTYWVTSLGQKYESTPRLPITITPNALPTALIIGDAIQYSCENSISLSAEAVEGAIYRWLRFGFPVTETTEPTFETDLQGTYVLEVVNPAGCKLRSEAVKVFLNAVPEAKIYQGISPVFCESGILEAKPINGASYEWQKDGITLGTGESLRAEESGTYTLLVTRNGCTTEASTDVTINSLGDISLTASNSVICPGSSTELTASFIADADYELLRNGRIEQRSAANTFTVTKPGTYAVRISSGTCRELSETLEIERIEVLKMTLRQEGNTLIAEDVSGNRDFASLTWFFNNEEAPEFAGQSEIRPTQNGVYRAEVIYESGCENTSNSLRYFTGTAVTGIEDDADRAELTTMLYPNPASESVILRLSSELNEAVTITLTDDLGRVLEQRVLAKSKEGAEVAFSLKAYASGLYFIRLEGSTVRFTKKFIKAGK